MMSMINGFYAEWSVQRQPASLCNTPFLTGRLDSLAS